jgi:hypothetical protein
MRSSKVWLVVMVALSLIAFGVAATSAYPRYLKTVPDALLWGLWDSAGFLVGVAISGIFVARRMPLPSPVALLLGLLLVGGALWAFVYLIALGL